MLCFMVELKHCAEKILQTRCADRIQYQRYYVISFKMRSVILSIIVLSTLCIPCYGSEPELKDDEDKWPTIGISMLVRDKAHSLPFVLSCLQQLDYPKDRMYVWFYIDNSVDKSQAIIETWIKNHKHEYNKVYTNSHKSNAVGGGSEWTEERLRHVATLREKAMQFARNNWADYIFMIDADVLITDPSTLKRLVRLNLPIVAPMLISDGLYSNFWDAMSESYYYEKTEQYAAINNRDTLGCFQVPMVHSAVLIALRPRSSDRLTYDPAKIPDYTGPVDDIIAFAVSAKHNDIPLTVCNDQVYGFIPVPVDMRSTDLNTTETEQLLNVKMEAISQGVHLPLEAALSQFVTYAPRDRLGVDRVFMINLRRRDERRRRMEAAFRELALDVATVDAVDGSNLNMNDLSEYGVTLMPKYEDPYHKRPMKAGEVGCFLSHYGIWKEIAARHIPRSLILEDDIRFVPFFRRRFHDLMRELHTLDWELVYIGRKILEDSSEEHVANHVTLPRYSYWTLGYLLSEDGARRLIQAEPLSKMLPLDEFLPIMFDQHPNETWKSYFRRRELKAYSAAPLLVYPTHYTGEPGYISDTEDSPVLHSQDSQPENEMGHHEL